MSKPNTTKKTQSGESHAVKFASSEMQGWRLTMEDSKIINLSLDHNTILFGVFDGHGGGEVSQFVSRHFASLLLKNKFYEIGDIEKALSETFVKIDELLKEEESIRELIRIKRKLPNNHPIKEPKLNMAVGCTALVVVIRENVMYIANAGDCRCVMSRMKIALDLTQDHKPNLKMEKLRIHNAGGKVIDGRINRGLNLSRSLGDFIYKRNTSLPAHGQMVIPHPDTFIVPITKSDEFFILACDGIWESLTSQECVDLVSSELSTNPLSKIAENILSRCLAPTNQSQIGCDNMTLILVQFNQPELPSASMHPNHNN